MMFCKMIPALSLLCFALLLLCSGIAHAKKDLFGGSRPVSTGKTKKASTWFRSFDMHAFEGISAGVPGSFSFVKEGRQRGPLRQHRKILLLPVFEKGVKGAMLTFSW